MSRHALFLACFLLIPLIYFFSYPIALNDLGIWIASGRQLWATKNFLPAQDAFSVLPTQAAVFPWGASLLYAALDWLGGLALVSILHKAVTLFFLCGIYRLSLRPLKNPSTDVWTLRNLAFLILAWAGGSILCIDRPAVLAVLPFLAAFAILNQSQALSRKDLCKLAALEIVWMAIHGSWILLPAMALWRAVFRSLHEKKILLQEWSAFALALAASLLNPFGGKIWQYAFTTASISQARGLTEWQPTGLGGIYFPQGLLFYALAGALILFLYRKIKITGAPWLAVASPYVFLALIGPHSIRNTIWLFLALLPYAASQGLLSAKPLTLKTTPRPQLWLNAALVSLLISITFLFTPYLKPWAGALLPEKKRPVYDEYSPFDLAQAIRDTQIEAPIFNGWEYGGFLLWALPNKIFIDSRNILYTDASFAEFLLVREARPGWDMVLKKYGARFALVNKRQEAKLAATLAAAPGWRKLAENADSVLYFR